ncbi:MAG: peptidylprolyl isomerase [Polyangiaceae bacterium]|jgi:NIMA-interacting peptidyl-prolyl cis-trans isomerase 1|nr:peptidylprolyl isomerase [Polyangiaceae bacterium]MBK8942135.1 peptidylprolyl isomerase [Polyangiaceae bacterium]
MRRLALPLLVALASCTTVTSSPSWVGGTLAEGAPARIEKEEAELKRETESILKEPKTIGAKHILVMHNDSERKPPTVNRTKAEAKKRAEEAQAKAKAGEPFDKLVMQYSDEPGASERAGDLGVFEKKVMVKTFSDAAFKLKVGDVSEVVETPFGFHVIMRTE